MSAQRYFDKTTPRDHTHDHSCLPSHSTPNFVDRLVQAQQNRALNNSSGDNLEGSHAQVKKEREEKKNEETASAQLEEEMDSITDPALLEDAGAYQDGK
jgi:hypothetical protein